MVVFHHVNLGVSVGGADDEAAFLVGVLGYRQLGTPPEAGPGARWFEGDDGKQVHLSEDPDHRPAARAHVAVELGDGLPGVETRLGAAGIRFRAVDAQDRRTVFCKDPSGNRWELRGPIPAA